MVGKTVLHYRILSRLGAGGMGEVFLAQDAKLDRQVALKILPPEFAADAERMSRFVREAKSASALNHPNIITIHEIGADGDTHFIATEYIEGETLHTRLQGQPLNQTTVLEIALQITSALDAAHSAGIVHRDIKPENVMLRPDGLVKLLDFGIAKLSVPPAVVGELNVDGEAPTAIKPAGTSPGMVIGTASYMSPEQARGQAVDARSDIFSFGLVLYEMLAGRRAFAGENALDVIGAILHKEPVPLNQIRHGLPHEIERIVNKTLRKERDERYPTAKDLLLDLQDAKQELEFQDKLERTAAPPREEAKTQLLTALAAPTTDEPQSPTSSAEFIAQEIRKHKRGAAVGLAVLLTAVIGLGYWFFFQRAAGNKQIESIAVMPFVNESGNADVEYLSDGMTETLIKSLSELPNLNVKPRSSVFRYKGKDTELKTIGKELNVEAILNGRVIQRGEQLTLSLELVDVQNDKVLWTESYQRKQSDLVSLQSEIAKDVSTKLKSKLSGAEEATVTKTATANPEAYQAYLKGRYYWNRRTAENLKKAIEQFKAATDRDPNYALAYVGLADCYVVMNNLAGTPTSETRPQAKAYAERAIAIDGLLGEPHASLAQVNRQSWQWAESEREFKRAIELNPNYATAYQWYAILLRDLGRFDESALMIMRAKELDPLSSPINSNLSSVYLIQKDYDASIENSLKLIELDPNFSNSYVILGLSYLRKGRNTEAIATLEKAVELSNRDVGLSELGYGYGVTGKRTEANAIVKELEEMYARKESNGFYVAGVYMGLGDKDKAYEWLEKDIQTKSGNISNIRWAIPFESLRDDPRYKDLLKRMGLPE